MTALSTTLLKPAEVCALLAGVALLALRRGRRRPHPLGSPRRPDGPLRFVKADLEAWLEERRAGWTPGPR